MVQESIYDPAERDLAKRASRDKDDLDLASGRVSAKEMSRINSFIPPEVARAAVILSWKEME
jgi:hypothetical protein